MATPPRQRHDRLDRKGAVMNIDLDKLADDGDTIDLEDGRKLRLRIMPDEDASVFDVPFYGEFAWVKRDSWTGRDQERPDNFDGNAEKMSTYSDGNYWWQPPRGDYAMTAKRGSKEFADFRQIVKDLVEYGFCGVVLELLDGEDTYGRNIAVEHEALWGIDSLNHGCYLAEIVRELAGELGLVTE
jgi:hypothetical protein